jgi:uncharacterized OB-fold protein
MSREHHLMSSVRLPFSFAVGAVASRFYQALRDEKTIYGTRCDGCAKVFVPARSFCGHCRKAIDHEKTGHWVALPDNGTLVGWCETPLEEGYFNALIQLPGADNFLVHRVGQCAVDQLQKGMPVNAVWNELREGKITDIVCFRPDAVGGGS